MGHTPPLGLWGHHMSSVGLGAYLQCGSVEDDALSEPHALAYGHSLPDGDVGAQLWRIAQP